MWEGKLSVWSTVSIILSYLEWKVYMFSCSADRRGLFSVGLKQLILLRVTRSRKVIVDGPVDDSLPVLSSQATTHPQTEYVYLGCEV